MVSRNTSILLAVAIIAIGAVAIIGVAYAYTASTDNTGNTSGDEYIILSQGGSYTGAFNGNVKYDTITNSTGTTYEISSDQFKQILSSEQMGGGAAVYATCLGTKDITVTGYNNATNFKFSVSQKETDGMTGTYYIGIKVGNGDEQIRAFTSTTGTANYYKETSNGDHGDVPLFANGTAIDAVDDGSVTITVKLYLTTISGSALLTTPPLNNVAFEFKTQTVTA